MFVGFVKFEIKLFRDLNLTLSAGNIYGLLGKNGAGKTTLLKIIMGLLIPKNGECKVFDYNSKNRSPGLLKQIYFIPEEFFLPSLTIKEYLLLYSGFYPLFDKNLFNNYLEEFSLTDKKKLNNMSYGQKKKFLISFGLSANTKLLIMDEPTNGLDIPGKSQFRKLLISSFDEKRIILISTHQVRDIQQLIDPILILDEGQIIFNQSMEMINKRLKVELSPVLPPENKILFHEKVIGGYALLKEDNNGSANVDLELLFNAVINNKEKFSGLFNKIN